MHRPSEWFVRQRPWNGAVRPSPLLLANTEAARRLIESRRAHAARPTWQLALAKKSGKHRRPSRSFSLERSEGVVAARAQRRWWSVARAGEGLAADRRGGPDAPGRPLRRRARWPSRREPADTVSYSSRRRCQMSVSLRPRGARPSPGTRPTGHRRRARSRVRVVPTQSSRTNALAPAAPTREHSSRVPIL
jgi:hypothetical protein